MHACVGSNAELQTATLTVMRQLVAQPTGPNAFLTAQAIPLLAMLQHSLVAEIKTLASRILDRIAGSSRTAEQAVMEEQQMQVCHRSCFSNFDTLYGHSAQLQLTITTQNSVKYDVLLHHARICVSTHAHTMLCCKSCV